MPRKKKTEVVEETQATETAAPEVTEAPAAEATGDAEAPQLTLADVKNAVNIIDYFVNQHGVKGYDTFGQIIQVRQRLAAFVEAASPAVEGEEAAETTETTDEAANG